MYQSLVKLDTLRSAIQQRRANTAGDNISANGRLKTRFKNIVRVERLDGQSLNKNPRLKAKL